MLFNNTHKINRAMLKAAQLGAADKLKQLLAEGADVSYRDSGDSVRTALILAVENGNAACVKVLLECAQDIEQTTTYGKHYGNYTALNCAAHNGSLAIVKMLREAGANLNPIDLRGRTPLMEAARNGHPEIVAYLLEKGALTYLRDNEGQDAESHALKSCNLKAAALLKKPSGPKADGEWRLMNENAVCRTVPFGDGSMALTEHVDFAEKTYTTILRDAEGKFSHTRQPFNHVAKPLIQQASAARRELRPPPELKALPKPEPNEMRPS